MHRYLVSNKTIDSSVKRKASLTSSEANAIEKELKLLELENESKKETKLVDATDFKIRVAIGNYSRLYGRRAAQKKYQCSYNTVKRFDIPLTEFMKLNPGVHIDDINKNDIPVLVPKKLGAPSCLDNDTEHKVKETIEGNVYYYHKYIYFFCILAHIQDYVNQEYQLIIM